ncbi:hypothetical protein BDFB_007911 [Asbolus verrucosus]|uniref:Uncharacterized protein n=1 Tax=Asbolus verrucosus TaxID=1661398 RepID=A0A482V8T1_ASBVE|nr:hypothetical protein BDFB_007911 [Asbolus verrucosus]
MRRSSNAILQSQTSEPLIVVEDSNYGDVEEKKVYDPDSRHSSEDESPTMNPYLLSPYSREIRKHSLPTPQCSGITASQVRRLSERGETVGPGPRQTEFLATLSTAPAPSPGGRRHSVVTISKLPPSLFGRNRRESVAAFPSGAGFPVRVLPNRRESIACPPSTEPRGSVHNLQLDIMDDIVQARKVRMKLWNTSNERVCEVQPLDDASSVQRYTNSSNRRYSDFVGTTLAPIPSSSKRRASELPPPNPCTTSASKLPTTGIVCSNTDLISILSSLSTSSTEINQCEAGQTPKPEAKSVEQKRGRLKSNRSNSFDISILHAEPKPNDNTPSNWLAQRHQPKPEQESKDGKSVVETEPGKVVWDERSGSLVDAHALGSAIEVFLRQTTPDSGSGQTSPHTSPNKGKTPTTKSAAGRSKTSWFSNKGDGDSSETCDSSLCSTLKDLFVK